MLKTKFFFILLVLVFIIAVYFYYLFDKSYMLSLEAKKHYKSGAYREAMDLAGRAYDLNQYNRMAFTVLVQSEKSLKWKKYVKQTEEYLAFAEAVSRKEHIPKSDLLRIKMICEVSVADFEKLNPKNQLIDPELQARALALHNEILAIQNELFK